jgi:lysophospholipase L1-like esterase
MRPLIAATFALALALGAAHAQKSQPTPIRIMPVGDSITEGGDGAGGYRRPLFDLFTAAYGMPNMVGSRSSRQNDPADFIDQDQDGYSAYRIDQIASGKGFWNALPIEERLRLWDPAIVTLHAGTNDAQQNRHFDGNPKTGMLPVIDRLDELVSRIVAFNPQIYVIVAQIVPANPPATETTADYIRRLNALIPGLVAKHQGLGHRVSMVDLYTPMLAYPHPDGIHPSTEGYQVMGREWFAAIQALGVSQFTNPDPGRFAGLQQAERYSTTSSTPWKLAADGLVRNGAASLASVTHTGYTGAKKPSVLNDGSQQAFTNDPDRTWTTTYTLNTTLAPAGYDITEVRTSAGLPTADNGDERSHQAYELWWASVDAPDTFVQVGDFHHIMVNTAQQASQIALTRAGGAPIVQRAAKIQLRFKQPATRQYGFIGVDSPAHYREIEVLGAPTAH